MENTLDSSVFVLVFSLGKCLTGNKVPGGFLLLLNLMQMVSLFTSLFADHVPGVFVVQLFPAGGRWLIVVGPVFQVGAERRNKGGGRNQSREVGLFGGVGAQ